MSQQDGRETDVCECEANGGDEELIICRCEEVSREEILQAIREGARTVEEVKRRTRAGMGLCQGKTCSKSVQRFLAEQTGQAIGEVMPSTFRPPVRPVTLGVLASLDGEGEDDVS
jgi:NAD(P)H-nitrite reductase large subunit